MSRHISFTLESDAVTGDTWNKHVAQLVELAGQCNLIDLARTTGARREAAAGKDAVAADRRRVLMEQLTEVRETAVLGVSSYGEALFGRDEDQDRLDAIRRVLWPEKQRTDLSETNDVIHLATHLSARRDYFVTTDQRVHGAREQLLGRIRVVAPDQALELARAACDMPAEGPLP